MKMSDFAQAYSFESLALASFFPDILTPFLSFFLSHERHASKKLTIGPRLVFFTCYVYSQIFH